MSEVIARGGLSFHPARICALLVPTLITATCATPVAFAQSTASGDGYLQGPTRPFDGTKRSGIYSARPAPSYERTPQRLGYEQSATSYQPPIWNGVYAGANGGYGRQSTTIEGWNTPDSTRWVGRLGGHVGYNWQIASFVVGLEGDLSRASNATTLTSGGSVALMQTSWESTLRARAGVSVGQALIYATGGAAFNKQRLTLTSTGLSLASNDLRVGTVLGGGVELMLAQRISARLEAIRYDFREPYATLSLGSVKQYDTTVRAGLTIHLN